MNAPAVSKKLPRGCWWTVVVVGGLLLVMGVLSFLAIPKLWKRSREVWTETQGTLVESYLKEGVRRSSDGRTGYNPSSTYDTYDVRLKYRYQVDGKDYNSDEKAPRQPKDDENRPEAQAVRESYKAGEAIAVFYRPDNAESSRFTAKEPPIEFKMDLFFVTVYLLGGGALFLLGRKMLQ